VNTSLSKPTEVISLQLCAQYISGTCSLGKVQNKSRESNKLCEF